VDERITMARAAIEDVAGADEDEVVVQRLDVSRGNGQRRRPVKA
jgi:hypothetical protein